MKISKVENIRFISSKVRKTKKNDDEITKILKDNENENRKFFGYRKRISRIINDAKDKALAKENLTILMQADDGRLSEGDISEILKIAVDINNETTKKEYLKNYGFEGGILTDESITNIRSRLIEERQMAYRIMEQQYKIKTPF